ncbi:hypothetical protein NDU88_004540 [Pleurodeles waltl]|uniref:Uncharacterized protein n=1 Tax=Pleurodeles waltl TaxID=8319 RepID=A0AAV7UHE2_PLEWA|nr:hypothetical protein NDU88_004540 [Pleurodeles waltl]
MRRWIEETPAPEGLFKSPEDCGTGEQPTPPESRHEEEPTTRGSSDSGTADWAPWREQYPEAGHAQGERGLTRQITTSRTGRQIKTGNESEIERKAEKEEKREQKHNRKLKKAQEKKGNRKKEQTRPVTGKER